MSSLSFINHNHVGTPEWDWSPVGLDLRAGQEFFDGTMYGHEAHASALAFGPKPWAESAACYGQPLTFDATDGAHPLSQEVKAARALCFSCPALSICREEVMAEESGMGNERYAVRAGMTPGERAALWASERVEGLTA